MVPFLLGPIIRAGSGNSEAYNLEHTQWRQLKTARHDLVMAMQAAAAWAGSTGGEPARVARQMQEEAGAPPAEPMLPE